jgi:hypothetical protein
MRDDVRREFEKRIRGLPNERIEAEMEEWAYDSEGEALCAANSKSDAALRTRRRNDAIKS